MLDHKPAPELVEQEREEHLRTDDGAVVNTIPGAPPLENPQKNSWDRMWPVMACGAGLFSDGYLNG